MVLNVENVIGDDKGTLPKENKINIGRKNFASTIVALNTALLVTHKIQSYGAAAQKLKGFKTTWELKNKSGAPRNISIIITNNTQSTTLHSSTDTLSDGEVSTVTQIWSTDQIRSGDFIWFALGDQGIGTAPGAASHAYANFAVESIEETDEPT